MRDHRDPAVTPSRLVKVEGAGNDFILGTGRWARRLRDDPALTVRLCHRRRGIGADGTLALSRGPGARVELGYRNADGTEAAFCANGTRCAARAAVELMGLPARLTVHTGWGPVPAEVRGDTVLLELPEPGEAPRSLRLEAAGGSWSGWLLTVGVPHLVLPVEGLGELDVERLGSILRRHPALGPGGANVHFVELAAGGVLAIRSFERGVEAETWACGSGAVAAALGWLAEKGGSSLVCRVRSGDTLRVEALGRPPRCPSRLGGPARLVAEVEPLPDLTG